MTAKATKKAAKKAVSRPPSSPRSAVTVVPDGLLRRRVYHLYAGGADVADIAERTGVHRDKVGELLTIIGWQRGRAAAAVRDYDAAHGAPPPPRVAASGQDLATAIRAAVRAELAPAVRAVQQAAEKVAAHRPVPTTAAPGGLAEQLARLADAVNRAAPPPGVLDELLAGVQAISEAVDVRTAATPAVAPGTGPDGASVLDRWDGWLCRECGSRYRSDSEAHRCGRLTPITVTITVRDGAG